MNKLTDSEIVKALELCKEKKCRCLECPIDQHSARCISLLAENALDLTNRQKAEIENLKVEKLKHFLAYEKDRKRVKSEAIKEFAEKLKCRSHRFKTIDRIFVDCIPLDYIDNLVKEMTEQTTLTKIEHNSLCETETYKGGV